MSVLLDTQIAVLAVVAPDKLTERERRLIAEPSRPVLVSLVTPWEIAIKNALPRRKDRFPFSTAQALSQFREAGFGILPITERHLYALEDLPLIHGGPFDRLLVAQAVSDGLMLLTRDAKIISYFAEG